MTGLGVRSSSYGSLMDKTGLYAVVLPTNRTKACKMMHKERVHWICKFAGRKKVGMLLLFLISAGKGEDGQEVQVPLSLHFNGTSVVNHLSFTYKRRAKYQHSESIFSSHKCHTVSSSSYTFFWLYASSRTSLSHVHLTSCSIKYSAKLILLQYSAKLLKKPDQCRAVYACSHLFWLEDHETIQDGERVLRCLKRALKIANSAQQMTSAARGSTGTVTLFIEILNKYLYFFEKGIPQITVESVESMIQLIKNEESLTSDPSAESFLASTLRFMEFQKQKGGAIGDRYEQVKV